MRALACLLGRHQWQRVGLGRGHYFWRDREDGRLRQAPVSQWLRTCARCGAYTWEEERGQEELVEIEEGDDGGTGLAQ